MYIQHKYNNTALVSLGKMFAAAPVVFRGKNKIPLRLVMLFQENMWI